DLLDARGLLELAGRLLEAQVELLLLQAGELVGKLVGRLGPYVDGFHLSPSLFCDALHEARADRELGGAEAQRLAGHLFADAVDLEHDAAGLDAGRPILDGALALAHAHFGRLAGDRHVREDADPHAALALHLAGDRAAG